MRLTTTSNFHPATAVKVTVAILAYKNNTNLLRAMSSVLKSAGSTPFQLTVIDNDAEMSAAGAAQKLVEGHCALANGGYTYVVNQHNNIGWARQLALQNCRTPYLAFLDSDCEAVGLWLQNILMIIESERARDSSVVAVGGANRPPPRQNSFYLIVSLMREVIWGHLNSVQLKIGQVREEVDHLPTTNVIYFCDSLHRAGGFAERHSLFGEDIDLSFRLRAQAGHLIYVPGLEVLHYESDGFASWTRRAFRFGRAQQRVVCQTNVRHALNRRVLWPLGFLVIQLTAFCFSFYDGRALAVFGLYVVGLLSTSFILCARKKETKWTLHLTALFFISHWAYPVGQVYEFFQQCFKGIQQWTFNRTLGPAARWVQNSGFVTRSRE